MKKKIFSIALIVAMIITGNWYFNQNENKVELSNLTLANIEALANCEAINGHCWMSLYTMTCCNGGDNGCAQGDN